ncbi:nucleoside triphosphate pyrophosphatase [Puniceibacterium sp. IMCC21224]|uniref:Maf family protein n=1 Tax=Puniceibacterium sp. IMCC21224 TaxID=1618204 RepID=UPI00064DE1CB|nr:nucleoside triphosphate pyrophosphatase [Puniceibacterium sp. IMCC21224]
MPQEIILASGSQIRAQMLSSAQVPFRIERPRIDEDAVRDALVAENASPRDIADALAELKADKISRKLPGSLVIGCDQVLAIDGEVMAKPRDPAEARAQICRLQGQRHNLLSAVVLIEDGQPIWRHVGQARLHMRGLSDAYVDAYLARNWDSIRHSVGGYKLEEEGVRLFSRIEGDHFTILGLPLIELLNYLVLKGTLPS